jgi:hypothetical protein
MRELTGSVLVARKTLAGFSAQEQRTTTMNRPAQKIFILDL